MITSNSSPATVSSATASRSASKPSAVRQTAKGQDFDAILDGANALQDADATVPGGVSADEVLRREERAELQADQPMTPLDPHRDERQEPSPAAEEAARANLYPNQQPLRAEMASEVTPRRILHVVDMEKIVATVRAQTFSGNEAQATIQLSHSILNGLSIKLQTDARGRVSAEITATTEAAKRIVDAHARELHDMLQARGLDVTAFSTSLSQDGSSAFAGGDGASEQSLFGRSSGAERATEGVETVADVPVRGESNEGIYTA